RFYISPCHNDWDEYLPLLEFTYNSSKQTSTGYSPLFLDYGVNPPALVGLIDIPNHSTYVLVANPTIHAQRIVDNIASAPAHLRTAQSRQTTQYNKNHNQCASMLVIQCCCP